MNLPEPAWYCVRSQPKHEHIAAASLRRMDTVEVFSPRLRVRRAMNGRPAWVMEALFPGYLFARFALEPDLEAVRYSFGVKTVLRFGGRWAAIDDFTIQDLRERLGGAELIDYEVEIQPGEQVSIAAGPFRGLTAVVQRYMPAAQRVQVLLEFLGRPTPVEVAVTSLDLGHRPFPGLMVSTATAVAA